MKNNEQLMLKSRILGGLFGIAVGDALGAPVEFMNMFDICKKYGKLTEMVGGGWLKLAPGEITDDTQMTIAVAEGIIKNPKHPVPTVGKNFITWLDTKPKDVSNTCRKSINFASNKIRTHKSEDQKSIENDWIAASKETSRKNGNKSAGNGALMRNIYPGLYYPDAKEAEDITVQIAQMTHYDEISNDACILYTKIIQELLYSSAKDDKKEIIHRVIKHTIYSKTINELFPPTGYVIDSMSIALYCLLNTNSFEEAVITAVNFGGDADTNGAITGGLAGVMYGFESIPDRWLDKLEPSITKKMFQLVDAAYENQLVQLNLAV